jgi:hypothetical protein
MRGFLTIAMLAALLAAGCETTQKIMVIYVDQNGNPIDPPPNLNRAGQRTTTVSDGTNTGVNKVAVAPGTPATGSTGTPTSVGTPGGNPSAQPTVNVRAAVAPSPQVDKLELESLPSAVNLDDVPGPDGIKLALRLYSLKQPLAFVLQKGEIEFVIYEGTVKEADIAAASVFHSWRFNASDIAGSGKKTLVGWQYSLSLNWLGHVPSTQVITLVARIPRPGESPLYARPVHLAMGPR